MNKSAGCIIQLILFKRRSFISSYLTSKLLDALTKMGVEFLVETIPQPSREYFAVLDKRGNKVRSSKIATVTVFYNEDGFALDNTMKCLDLQQDIDTLGQDLLLVGDGITQMSPSMAQQLSTLFSTETLPIHIEDWPEWANTCIVTNSWRHGRLRLVLKKIKWKWNSHEWHMRSFANDAEFSLLTDVGCQITLI